VSLAGSNYAVYIGGDGYAISGTSASAPVMAGMLSNINAARIAAGKGSVGWANPAMYANSARFVRDITSGNSFCAALTAPGAFPNCCPQGFYATTGWDPVTGLGTVNYGKMETAFLSIGSTKTLTTGPSQSPVVGSATPATPSLPIKDLTQTGDSNREFHCES
jgi:tripeptidyl-peptidase I